LIVTPAWSHVPGNLTVPAFDTSKVGDSNNTTLVPLRVHRHPGIHRIPDKACDAKKKTWYWIGYEEIGDLEPYFEGCWNVSVWTNDEINRSVELMIPQEPCPEDTQLIASILLTPRNPTFSQEVSFEITNKLVITVIDGGVESKELSFDRMISSGIIFANLDLANKIVTAGIRFDTEEHALTFNITRDVKVQFKKSGPSGLRITNLVGFGPEIYGEKIVFWDYTTGDVKVYDWKKKTVENTGLSTNICCPTIYKDKVMAYPYHSGAWHCWFWYKYYNLTTKRMSQLLGFDTGCHKYPKPGNLYNGKYVFAAIAFSDRRTALNTYLLDFANGTHRRHDDWCYDIPRTNPSIYRNAIAHYLYQELHWLDLDSGQHLHLWSGHRYGLDNNLPSSSVPSKRWYSENKILSWIGWYQYGSLRRAKGYYDLGEGISVLYGTFFNIGKVTFHISKMPTRFLNTISDNIIVGEWNEPTDTNLYIEDITTGQVKNMGIPTLGATLHKGKIAFSTWEGWWDEDFTGDGDKEDWVIGHIDAKF
jgi:hypothetical protein